MSHDIRRSIRLIETALSEGREAPLYHGTTIDRAIRILQTNTIEARTEHRLDPRDPARKTFGVSLSRTKGVSDIFGDVVFELDQAKLAQSHRIIPVAHPMQQGLRGGGHIEQEEFVVGPIKPLTRYLRTIHLSDDAHQMLARRPELQNMLGLEPALAETRGFRYYLGLVEAEQDRLQRAREMGFDPDETWYHSTQYDFDEFVPSRWRQASYFAPTPDGASRGASAGGNEHMTLGGPTTNAPQTGHHIMPVHIRGKIWGRDPLPLEWFPDEITMGYYKEVLAGQHPIHVDGMTDQQNDSLNFERRRLFPEIYDEDPEAHARYAAMSDDEIAAEAARQEREPDSVILKRLAPPVPKPYRGYESVEGWGVDSFAPSGSMPREDRRAMMQKLGYDGWLVSDEGGTSVAMANTANIRSKFARFDPAKADSRNIMDGREGGDAVLVENIVLDDGSGGKFTVYVNPSSVTVQRLRQGPGLRGLCDGDDVAVWVAYRSDHNSVAHDIGWAWAGMVPFVMEPGDVPMVTDTITYSGLETNQQIRDVLARCGHFQRLFGDVEFMMPFNESLGFRSLMTIVEAADQTI